ncbi:hypothetical protein [Haloarcula salina]|uniref:Uncharacterized protein n=1 Tax=Haloarcula salina TaxID=1429914 RepID=A0AA41KLU6_9EURY|nr:hypothetical protein [Haloarcula salina]MBV0903264.1 hypothetical protein [Haloarcula salina]
MSSKGPASTLSTPIAWSLLAGAYAFVCSSLVLLRLGAVAGTLLTVLGLPEPYAGVLVPASAGVVGAVGWWALVERRAAQSYLLGALFGLTTAVVTVSLWTLAVAVVWGPRTVLLAGVVVIGFALAVTAPLGAVAGLPLMYARRRFGGLAF